MLATLNLQLSPVELLDDTLTSTAPLLPDAGGEVESGFAGLLRLRVDASLPSDPTGGEVLPPDGSDLPILSHLLATEAAAESAPAPEIATDASNPELVKLMPQLTVEGDATTLAGRPDIVLEDAVIYPPLNEAPAEVPASLLLAPPLQSPNAARPDAAAAQVAAQVAAGGRDAGDTLVPRPALPDGPPTTRPELAARIQDVLTFAGDRPAIPAASTGLLGRGQIEMPQTGTSLAATPTATTAPATVPAAITAPATQIDQGLPLVDPPKRPDIMPLQSATGLDGAVTETVQARGAAPSALQALHAQLNTATSQAMFTASPGTVAASDSTYAAAVQQATDLIGTSVRDSAWGERIGERVLMMAGNQLKTAEIRLTPAELGPLRVQVSVDDGAANVTFHAQHAVTREALEQALPRLREMLAENGLSLGQADVSEQGVAQGNKDGESDVRVSGEATDEAHDAVPDDDHRAAARATTSNGLVDTFA
jgi:flagellar hook-length control protein FliK